MKLFAFVLIFFTSAFGQQYFPSDSRTIDGLKLDEVSEIYATAFEELYDNSVNEIKPQDLTNRAFAGFQMFIPNIKAYQAGTRYMLLAGKETIGNFPAPIEQDDWDAWGHLMASMLLTIRNYDKNLVSSHPEQLYYATLSSIASSVDPNAKYINPKQAFTKAGSEKLASTSLGFTYKRLQNGSLQVLSVFENSPAAQKGLFEGDTITKVNSKPVSNLKDSELESYFYGRTNAIVPITATDTTSKKTKELNIRRASFIASPIELKMLAGGFAQVVINDFDINTKELVQEAIIHTYNTSDDLMGLILDLRGTGNGDITQAVALADMFLEDGIIIETRGRNKKFNKIYKASDGDLLNDRPIVVLIDQTTSSSAEVLAIALQQAGRAVIIGTPSKGDGLVQSSLDLPNGAKLLFSTSYVYDRDENFLDKRGVLPVICTSSIKNLDAQYKMIQNIKDKKFNSPVKQWQNLGADAMEEIAQIRAGCKPSDLSDDNIASTQSLALSILNDKDLYKKLITLQNEKQKGDK